MKSLFLWNTDILVFARETSEKKDTIVVSQMKVFR